MRAFQYLQPMLGRDEVGGHDRGFRKLARLSQGLPDMPQQDLLVL
jgi:hypothetical protein